MNGIHTENYFIFYFFFQKTLQFGVFICGLYDYPMWLWSFNILRSGYFTK